MKISQLIKLLEKAQQQEGDVDVICDMYEGTCDVTDYVVVPAEPETPNIQGREKMIRLY